MAQEHAYAALDDWIKDVMGKHEVRRVLRDLKLAELEMLLAVLQKARTNPPEPDGPSPAAGGPADPG